MRCRILAGNAQPAWQSGSMNTTNNTQDDIRWQAVLQRLQQTQFVYAVVSTGVVCRTGCPSRRPRRENVRFFDDLAEAVQAGYRPCKRCVAEDSVQRVASICRQIEECPELKLAQIAARQNLSSRQVQRLFREVLGVTPKQFEIQLRYRRFLQHLQEGCSVTEAIYAAGFRSSSRMYAQVWQRTGMTAGSLRRGAPGELVLYAHQRGELGEVVMAQTLKGLCFAGFFDDTRAGVSALQAQFPAAQLVAVSAGQLEPIASAFEHAAAGDYRQLAGLPLDIRGTAFQSAVWEAVRKVPVGMRVTYQELAAAMDKPQHARAVARALAGNSIALAIPCHRVVPAGGRATGGYRWGAERKSTLLQNES